MNWIKQFDLFLLDLDGLLVDTEPLHFAAYKTLCERHGYQLPWSLEQYLHIAHASADGLQKALHPYLKKTKWVKLYEEKKKIYEKLLFENKITLLPGVENFLNALLKDQKKRCVVTNSNKKQVEAIKKSLPILQTIPNWITREDYKNSKPEPDGYFLALKLLGGSDGKVIGFEDSVKGIQALKKASIFPVLISERAHLYDDLQTPKFASFEKINFFRF